MTERDFTANPLTGPEFADRLDQLEADIPRTARRHIHEA
jgi:hypothetical protein